MSTPAPVRVGVLGSAEIARRRLLPAMAASARTELVAVASRDRRRAAETARPYGGRAVEGYAALLDDPEVEAVYIPLPAALHAPWVAAALEAGKHVLAEKPLALEPARAAELFALAAERGLALMENVMFVHHAQHTAVRRLVADGAIGEPRDFQAAFAIPGLPGDDIRYSATLGGGALHEIGIYPVRAALHLLDGPLEVAGAVLHTGAGHEVETAGAALLRTPDGVSAQLTFGLDHAYRCRYQLWGSEGRLTLDRAFTPPAGHEPVLTLERRAGGSEEIRLPPDDQVTNTLAVFADAVRLGTGTGAGDTLRQARLLGEIHERALRKPPDAAEPGRPRRPGGTGAPDHQPDRPAGRPEGATDVPHEETETPMGRPAQMTGQREAGR